MENEVKVVVENAFAVPSDLTVTILVARLVTGNPLKGEFLIVDDQNKLKILEIQKAIEFEDGKILYNILVQRTDAENMKGTRLFKIYHKNICKII